MDDTKIERVYTPGMKRRSVLRVLKSALHDAQREIGNDRVVGIFGVIVKEDGTASLLSALTLEELKVVLKAIPEGIGTITRQFQASERGN